MDRVVRPRAQFRRARSHASGVRPDGEEKPMAGMTCLPRERVPLTSLTLARGVEEDRKSRRCIATPGDRRQFGLLPMRERFPGGTDLGRHKGPGPRRSRRRTQGRGPQDPSVPAGPLCAKAALGTRVRDEFGAPGLGGDWIGAAEALQDWCAWGEMSPLCTARERPRGSCTDCRTTPGTMGFGRPPAVERGQAMSCLRSMPLSCS